MTAASDWLSGYQAAIDDLERLTHSRGLATPQLAALFADLKQDALVIEHETGARLQRRRLAAAREAQPQGSLL
jgi:hypothetical protein